jgi:cyclase
MSAQRDRGSAAILAPSRRLKMKTLILLALLLSCSAYPARAQTDWSKVEIKVIKVSGNVYMLEGAGGNIGVSVGPDGILIVDDQFAPLADKINSAFIRVNPRLVS